MARITVLYAVLFEPASVMTTSADEEVVAPLVAACEGNQRMQVELIRCVMRQAAETPALMKATPLILKNLYDNDAITDEAVAAWAADSSATAGVDADVDAEFRAKVAPFVTWVAEAEEGSSSEEDDE